MKLAIVGSRDFNGYDLMNNLLEKDIFYNLEIVSGGAKGADALAEFFANMHNLPITIFKADWVQYGKSAGYKRNVQIVGYCDQLIAFWDGKSKGTKHSIDLAKKAGKLLKIVYF